MVNKCIVPRCPTRGPKHKYFCVPFTNKPRWKLWSTICPYLNNVPFIKRSRIRFCAKHFLPDHINEKQKLKPNAIPLLDLKEIESDVQLAIEPTDNVSEPYIFDLITNPGIKPSVRPEPDDSQPPCTDLEFANSPQPIEQIEEDIVPCIELNFDDIRLNQHTTEISYTSFCVCCLQKHSHVIDLSSCKHKDFLNNLSIPDFKPHNPVVCLSCHSLLKKINEFQHQVQESFKMLSEMTFSPSETNSTRLTIVKTVDELINPNDIETVHLPPYTESTEDTDTPESVRLRNIQTAQDIINSNNASPLLGLLSGINDLKDVLGSVSEDLSLNFKGSDSLDVDFITTPSAGEHMNTENINEKRLYLDAARKPKKNPNPIKKVKLTKKQLMRERYYLSCSKAYLKYPYRCKDCIRGFNYKKSFDDHVRRKHNVTSGSQCEICLQCLPDQILHVHKDRHFVRYVCTQCNNKYRSRDEATYHYSRHHSLRTNCNTHTQAHRPTCPHCGLVCHSQRKLRWHVKVRHKKDSQESPQVDPTESHSNNNYCSKCDVEFKTSHTCFDEYSDLVQELGSICGKGIQIHLM